MIDLVHLEHVTEGPGSCNMNQGDSWLQTWYTWGKSWVMQLGPEQHIRLVHKLQFSGGLVSWHWHCWWCQRLSCNWLGLHQLYLGLVEAEFPPTEVYFGLVLSDAHLCAPSEVYLGLVTDLDSSTEVYFGLVLSEAHLCAPSEVYLGLVTDLESSTEVYFGLGLSEAHLGAPSEVYLDLVTDLDSLTEVYPGPMETDPPQLRCILILGCQILTWAPHLRCILALWLRCILVLDCQMLTWAPHLRCILALWLTWTPQLRCILVLWRLTFPRLRCILILGCQRLTWAPRLRCILVLWRLTCPWMMCILVFTLLIVSEAHLGTPTVLYLTQPCGYWLGPSTEVYFHLVKTGLGAPIEFYLGLDIAHRVGDSLHIQILIIIWA